MQLLIFIFLSVSLFFLIRFFLSVKIPKVGAFAFVTGGVKAGKTTFAVALAVKNYKRSVLRWRISKIVAFILRKPMPEKPLFYSNIPVAFDYVPLTEDIILRKKRMNYKSVVLISEASLVADSMSFGDPVVDENLTLFVKLFGHETHGGLLVTDSQAIADCHYGFKRNVTQMFYIHDTIKWIPFFILGHVIEERYQADNASVIQNDVEDNVKTVLFSKKVWKLFDCYCYSKFTDDLPVENTIVKYNINDDLRTDNVVSFKKYKTLKNNKRGDLKCLERKTTFVQKRN